MWRKNASRAAFRSSGVSKSLAKVKRAMSVRKEKCGFESALDPGRRRVCVRRKVTKMVKRQGEPEGMLKTLSLRLLFDRSLRGAVSWLHAGM